MQYDAILMNVTKYPLNPDKLIGFIYEDRAGRWADGTQVVTSVVKSIVKEDNTVGKVSNIETYAITKSGTVYLLASTGTPNMCWEGIEELKVDI